jgi:hypothetical protein
LKLREGVRLWPQDRCLLALERLGGDAGFELGGEVSSLAFHRSDFGVIRPSQTSQSFNRPLAPFHGTTSARQCKQRVEYSIRPCRDSGVLWDIEEILDQPESCLLAFFRVELASEEIPCFHCAGKGLGAIGGFGNDDVP